MAVNKDGRKIVECRGCGQGQLVWVQAQSGKWYLTSFLAKYGQRKPHRCPRPRQVAEEPGLPAYDNAGPSSLEWE
jgi:hypothetical protein